MFVIEDEAHAELQKGQYTSFGEAFVELKRRADIPWNEDPNRCPCTSWQTCGRSYEVIEYDDRTLPWTELSRRLVLEISATGINWIATE